MAADREESLQSSFNESDQDASLFDMRRDGVLIVMRGKLAGGPVGSWQAMYTQWDKITNQLYRYSSWIQLERDLYHLF